MTAKTGKLGVLFLCVTGLAACVSHAAEHPNFVIFVADDMAWDDCGAYGHPAIHTPHIDRLAREGMRFDQAWLTCSSCSPSRCSMLTGRYPHATGAGELHLPLPADQVLLTTPLREAGFWTASVGKWHLGNAAIAQMDLVKQGGGPSGCEFWVPVLQDRPRDKPFFLWLAAVDPHRGYSPNTFDPPHSGDAAVVPPYLPDCPETRRDLAMYYDEIARLDSFVGKVLEELQRQEVLEDTFILFLSDNGRPFPRCKTTVYDSGVKTPFIVRYPRLVQAGSSTDRLVSTVDIAPTVLSLAGLEPLPSFQGVSFVPLLRNATATVRKYAFAEHNWHDYAALERGVRSERYNYIRNWRPDLPGTPPADAVRSPTYEEMQRRQKAGELPARQATCFATPRPVEELYDTQADPHALNNLADDAEYAEVLQELRAALVEWQRKVGDQIDPQTITPDGFDRQTGQRLINAAHPKLQK